MKTNLPHEAEKIILHLGLEKIDEGVYVKRIYEYNSDENSRPAATMIYGLATYNCPSRLHSLDCDEIWHFYAGNPLNIYIFQDAKVQVKTLGPGVFCGQNPVVIVPCGSNFGAMVQDSSHWCLFGCTCLPGFEKQGYTVTKTDADFYAKYPEYQSAIEKLTNYK